ncbi:uncharacterized protein [Palaemon carinicauda]|uniref:uncharacterized protein n=1 Tax=Palaemon carinicauda TaxID=392227 RepID=UPI0035B69629
MMGTTFTSQLWTSLANLLGIILPQTTIYKPAANGRVEDFHRTLKAALMSHCKDYSWFTQLSWVLLGLRTTPKDALDVSAAGMVYGDGLVVHPEYFPSATSSDNLKRLRHNVERFTLHCQTYKPQAKQHILNDLHSSMHVFLRKDTTNPPLIAPYMGLFLVIRRTLKACLLNMSNKESWVSIDRLKPAYLLPDNLHTNIQHDIQDSTQGEEGLGESPKYDSSDEDFKPGNEANSDSNSPIPTSGNIKNFQESQDQST